MPKQIINPPSLAPASGFNHGILVSGGQLLFLAGQTASNANGVIVAPGDIVRQYDQTLANLKTIIEAAGGVMSDIVKLNIFLVDKAVYIAHLKELRPVHAKYFGSYYPTMALFVIAGLFQEDALIELEGIAVIGSQ